MQCECSFFLPTFSLSCNCWQCSIYTVAILSSFFVCCKCNSCGLCFLESNSERYAVCIAPNENKLAGLLYHIVYVCVCVCVLCMRARNQWLVRFCFYKERLAIICVCCFAMETVECILEPVTSDHSVIKLFFFIFRVVSKNNCAGTKNKQQQQRSAKQNGVKRKYE